MGTVTVLTADKVYAIEANSVIGGSIDGSGHLILTKPGGITIDAGSVGSVVDMTNIRAKINAAIAINGSDANGVVETTTVTDDGTDSTTWIDRLVYRFVPVSGTARKTTFFNEYGELRTAPAKENTTGARFYVKETPTNPSAARDLTVPVVELMDDRVTRTSLRGWLGDGTTTRRGIKMADLLVLGPTDPVPINTPPGTVIFRQSSAPALNLNTGFEVDTSNWTATGGTLTRDTTIFKTGVASGKVTATGSVATSVANAKVAVTAGNTYRVTADLRCSIATTVILNVNWYNASNTLLSTSTITMTVGANTWATLAGSVVAPTGATQAAITPAVSGTPAAGVTFSVDNALLTV